MRSNVFLAAVLVVNLPVAAASDLNDLVPTADYWKRQGIVVSVDNMLPLLSDRPDEPPDVSHLIRDMGNDDFRVRDRASRQLRELGAAVLDQLREAAENDDAEIAQRARELVERLAEANVDAKQNRLMAIRAVGELKSRDALPALKSLLESDEWFVADYARRAIAQIEGTPLATPRMDPEALAADLRLVARGSEMVVRLTTHDLKVLSIRELFRPWTIFGFDDMDAQIQEVYDEVIKLTARVGNARIDAVTLALPENWQADDGFATFVFRGLYDAGRVAAHARELGMKVDKQGDVYVIDNVLLLPSNNQLVLFVQLGPPGALKKVPVDEILEVLKTGKAPKRDHPADAKLQALIESVDKTAPLWAVVAVGDSLRESWDMVLSGVESVVLSASQGDETIDAKVVLQGRDADEIARRATAFDSAARAASELLTEAGRLSRLERNILATVNSVDTKHRDKQLSVTLRADNLGTLLAATYYAGTFLRPAAE